MQKVARLPFNGTNWLVTELGPHIVIGGLAFDQMLNFVGEVKEDFRGRTTIPRITTCTRHCPAARVAEVSIPYSWKHGAQVGSSVVESDTGLLFCDYTNAVNYARYDPTDLRILKTVATTPWRSIRQHRDRMFAQHLSDLSFREFNPRFPNQVVEAVPWFVQPVLGSTDLYRVSQKALDTEATRRTSKAAFGSTYSYYRYIPWDTDRLVELFGYQSNYVRIVNFNASTLSGFTSVASGSGSALPVIRKRSNGTEVLTLFVSEIDLSKATSWYQYEVGSDGTTLTKVGYYGDVTRNVLNRTDFGTILASFEHEGTVFLGTTYGLYTAVWDNDDWNVQRHSTETVFQIGFTAGNLLMAVTLGGVDVWQIPTAQVIPVLPLYARIGDTVALSFRSTALGTPFVQQKTYNLVGAQFADGSTTKTISTDSTYNITITGKKVEVLDA